MQSRQKQVPSEFISVVIQGPLHRSLAPARGIDACISSVRAHLPYAEVIVSTWVGEDLTAINADVVVTSADPGALLDFNGNRHNTNRQIISTVAGIHSSSRNYILKLRSDHILTGSQISVIGAYDLRTSISDQLLQQPITVTTLFIRDPAKVPLLFHLSDLVQFGTREDMLEFWDQRPRLQNEVFAREPYKNPIGNFVGYSAMRMTPEQCLMLGFMTKRGFDISLKTPGEISPELVRLSEKILAENFTILDWNVSGINFPERFCKTGYSLKSIYKATKLIKIGKFNQYEQKKRYRHIWLNKYIFNYFRLAWWIALASILLTAVSPNIAKSARATARRFRGLEHPNKDRI